MDENQKKENLPTKHVRRHVDMLNAELSEKQVVDNGDALVDYRAMSSV